MMLEVSGLRAGYDGREVLSGLHLEVAAGETVCLIGANGAGKTTLMRCLSGLLRPSSGRISLDGRDVTRSSAVARVSQHVALVPEGRRVFGPMSVRENLQMGAYRRLWPTRDPSVEQDLDRVLELFPRLEQRLEQTAGTLSGGEQQMLAIGRALMSGPALLLLDEPTMGLAPQVVSEIFRSIRGLNDSGLAILIAEQNARTVLRTSHRGYVIAQGRIVGSGSSSDLISAATLRDAYL